MNVDATCGGDHMWQGDFERTPRRENDRCGRKTSNAPDDTAEGRDHAGRAVRGRQDRQAGAGTITASHQPDRRGEPVHQRTAWVVARRSATCSRGNRSSA